MLIKIDLNFPSHTSWIPCQARDDGWLILWPAKSIGLDDKGDNKW